MANKVTTNKITVKETSYNGFNYRVTQTGKYGSIAQVSMLFDDGTECDMGTWENKKFTSMNAFEIVKAFEEGN